MDYTEIRFFNQPEYNEIIIALLADTDFDMFQEREDGVNGYIAADRFNEDELKKILAANEILANITFETSFIKDQNWNHEWEKNFDPVLIANKVYIRAPFHETKNYPYELIIEPKMSFGTGHHSTTALMIELMLQLNFEGKSVLDMGCGSGVLAILAEKLKAKEILAIDFDNWAYQNTIENNERNQCHRIIVKEGTAKLIAGQSFDIILANINRNVLLADMEQYEKALAKNGVLLLSGILKEDGPLIKERAENFGLTYIQTAGHDNWIAMQFNK